MGILKRILKVVGLLIAVIGIGGGIFVWVECSKFDASMEKVYDVPVPNVTRSTDAAVVARGDHLVHSIAGCSAAPCHGQNLAGAEKSVEMGPLGAIAGPNLTPAGIAVAYSDGELARLIKHGIKKDGRSVRMMPVQDVSWMPDSDVLAIVSYLRTLPAVDRPNGMTYVGTLGKILDRQDQFVWD